MSSETPTFLGSIRKGEAEASVENKLVLPLPPPLPSDGPAVWDLVIADMQARDRMGTEKYGQRLGINDGRDSLVDAYQEVLDLAVYLRKEIARREPQGSK